MRLYVTIAAVLCVLLASACGGIWWYFFVREPYFGITVRQADDKQDFDFDASSQIVSIESLSVYSVTTKERLWTISHSGRGGLRGPVVYGVPTVGAKEVFPEDGKPARLLQDGEDVFLSTVIVYDQGLSACIGGRYFQFTYTQRATQIPCKQASWRDSPIKE